MLDANKYSRYEPESLVKWKKLSSQEQLEKVKILSKKFNKELEVIKVNNQAIEVNLIMAKNKVYDYLVSYESYIREKLGNFPVIVLLKDRADENKKRK